MLHLDDYVQLFEVFKEAARTASNKMIEVTSEIATVEKWLSTNKLESTDILPMLDLEINTDKEEKEFRSLSIELENISEKNKKILRNNQYKEMLAGISLDEVNSITATEKVSPDEFQKELGQLEAGMKACERMLQKLERLDDVCPTCEQKVDAHFKESLINEEKKTISFITEKIDGNTKKIAEIRRNNTQFDRKSKLQKDWEDLYRSIDTNLPTSILDKEQLEDRLASLQNELHAAKKEISRIAMENEKRTRQNTRIEIIEAQTDGFIEKLNKASETLKEVAELDANLETLKKAFSTNGLLAYKIENLVKELEELTNTYLAELSDGRFTLEFIVSNDKLNVQITDNESIVDILALSSGELARVNTATLIAIRKLMSSISKSRINILFLDEVINVLDESGREKLVEVLLQEDLNTYVVSHGWTHPLLHKIEVVKQGNVSGLEW